MHDFKNLAKNYKNSVPDHYIPGDDHYQVYNFIITSGDDQFHEIFVHF